MQDLIGGRIDYMCDTIQTGAEQAKHGTVKGIARDGATRADHRRSGDHGRAGAGGVEATSGTPSSCRRERRIRSCASSTRR